MSHEYGGMVEVLQGLITGRTVLIGRGQKAQDLLPLLKTTFGLNFEAIPRHDSADAPLGDYYYGIVGTPFDEISRLLCARGVPQQRIFKFEDIPLLKPLPVSAFPDRADVWFRLVPPAPDEARDLFLHHLNRGDGDRALYWVKQQYSVRNPSWDDAVNLVLLVCHTDFAARHTALFAWVCDLAGTVIRARVHRYRAGLVTGQKRLVFPSPGRCGGNSIAQALETGLVLPMRVGHEAYGQELYDLLRIYRQTGRSEPIILLLDCLLSQYDALGGNPYGLMLPFIRDLPFYDFTILWVRRDGGKAVTSILEHNFHYGTRDFIRNRVTAVDTDEMSADQWERLSREDKVRWYVAHTESVINVHVGGFQNAVVCSMDNIGAGLGDALRHLGLMLTPTVRKCNAVPYHRHFTPEELVILFQHFKQDEIGRLTPEEIEALLRQEMRKSEYARLYPGFHFGGDRTIEGSG
ncbi:MAG: hypothetical protein HYX75_15630 [Acidobacteria bacterium]|nr:hypothetical protein [Acidobacteriota bacterium]